jgi:hypothetical protein
MTGADGPAQATAPPRRPFDDMYIFTACHSDHLRAWTTRDYTVLAPDGVIARSPADTAWVDSTLNPGAAVRGSLFREAVRIGSDNANRDSPSGYLERRLFAFNAPVDPAPVAPVPQETQR